jgi:hypothetical protein
METTDLKKKAGRYHTLSRGYGSLKRPKAKMYEGAAKAYERLGKETSSSERAQARLTGPRAKG